jgi:hypothetical protein
LTDEFKKGNVGFFQTSAIDQIQVIPGHLKNRCFKTSNILIILDNRNNK